MLPTYLGDKEFLPALKARAVLILRFSTLLFTLLQKIKDSDSFSTSDPVTVSDCLGKYSAIRNVWSVDTFCRHQYLRSHSLHFCFDFL